MHQSVVQEGPEFDDERAVQGALGRAKAKAGAQVSETRFTRQTVRDRRLGSPALAGVVLAIPVLVLSLTGCGGSREATLAAVEDAQTSTQVPTAVPPPSPPTIAPSPTATEPPPTATPLPPNPVPPPAAPPPPPAPPTDPVAVGQAIFMANCTFCHPNGDQGIGPSLRRSTKTVGEIRTQVREGKDVMPAFGPNQISDAQLENLIQFELSLRR